MQPFVVSLTVCFQRALCMHCGFTYRTACAEKITHCISEKRNRKPDIKVEMLDGKNWDGQMHLAQRPGISIQVQVWNGLCSLDTASDLKELYYCNHFKFGTFIQFLLKYFALNFHCVKPDLWMITLPQYCSFNLHFQLRGFRVSWPKPWSVWELFLSEIFLRTDQIGSPYDSESL